MLSYVRSLESDPGQGGGGVTVATGTTPCAGSPLCLGQSKCVALTAEQLDDVVEYIRSLD